MKSETLDAKGLRLICVKCGSRLPRKQVYTKTCKCTKCHKINNLSPMDDIPYKDTNVPVHESQEDIIDMLEEIGLKECSWTMTRVDAMRGYRLSAIFEDGAEFVKEFPIPNIDNERHNKQLMRCFYHFVKAFTINIKLGIMGRSEAMLGLLRAGSTNLGTELDKGEVSLLGKVQRHLLT
ncbi:MAG: hypothetical protein HeimC2_32950 [Candidatus Heimdallarchaeota archaeon LC_2]|nr:MAG: hypothetical protein HeimC2_32950 [Candidatus Heimdallarchaeota archaeon LC_2]